MPAPNQAIAKTFASQELLSSHSSSIANLNGATLLAQAASLSPLEQAIIDEINKVRANPAAYADLIQNLKNQGLLKQQPPEALVNETIGVLRSTPSLPTLTVSNGINRAARDHVNNQLPQGGSFSHTGTDGSTPSTRMQRYGQLQGASGEIAIIWNGTAQDMVVAWLIDDPRYFSGPPRSHRTNILEPRFRLIGNACDIYGSSANYPNAALCVTDFAEVYQDNSNSNPNSDSNLTTYEQQVLERINQYRASKNLPPLKLNSLISDIARQESQAVAQGSSTNISQVGQAVGKVVSLSSFAVWQYWSSTSSADPVSEAVTYWLNNSNAQSSIESNFDLAGVGIVRNAEGKFYVTVIFVNTL